MKFVTYEFEGKESIGIMRGDKIVSIEDIANCMSWEEPKNMVELIEKYTEDMLDKVENILEKRGDFKLLSLDDVKIKAPIPYPKRNVLCLGKNYVEHAREIKITRIAGTGIPEEPIYFTKVASPAIGHEDEIKFSYEVTKQVDYEVELAIIIGKDGINIKKEDAEDYIFGYTIVNDVSARDLQGKHKQWFKGKSLDTFCPMGPCIVHKKDIPFPVELNIKCSVNGELRQNSNTKNLIFDIPYIISDLSKGMTLKAGDIICTGTPSGVGLGFEPIKVLKDGDTVECSIEKIGELVNKVKVI
ncbi:hydrolase [Clostridium carboxidivorans P7]|uniref:5-carboxymethyl-2-hydroxymuconate Delta-isomerase n=1 Tax=Clostridium carboxidivorans P7 TaxID=536227 RepID=C6PQ62_9CLOT|nr:fumarylacetoacetate hydrolase family protein [Clostridium carboxidivorans]AKN29620.1 hydrolase [Clostridium carboxidivorans P7]EET88667.1 5-carboxymethyl-2-hydroxymuconate Delta-isomerase [Clostridium carboxidivorans P7]EFG89455.1 FAH family protein [Clostridium carboxidivorans P7]